MRARVSLFERLVNQELFPVFRLVLVSRRSWPGPSWTEMEFYDFPSFSKVLLRIREKLGVFSAFLSSKERFENTRFCSLIPYASRIPPRLVRVRGGGTTPHAHGDWGRSGECTTVGERGRRAPQWALLAHLRVTGSQGGMCLHVRARAYTYRPYGPNTHRGSPPDLKNLSRHHPISFLDKRFMTRRGWDSKQVWMKRHCLGARGDLGP